MKQGTKILWIIEILAIIAFFVGYFMQINLLAILGGVYLVLVTLSGISLGALRPMIPLVLGIILTLTIHPWYDGVFWTAAVLDVFNIPDLIQQIIE